MVARPQREVQSLSTTCGHNQELSYRRWPDGADPPPPFVNCAQQNDSERVTAADKLCASDRRARDAVVRADLLTAPGGALAV
jgi:hypothetical protein